VTKRSELISRIFTKSSTMYHLCSKFDEEIRKSFLDLGAQIRMGNWFMTSQSYLGNGAK